MEHSCGLQVASVGRVVEEAIQEGILKRVVSRNQGLNYTLFEVEALLALLEHLAAAIDASVAHQIPEYNYAAFNCIARTWPKKQDQLLKERGRYSPLRKYARSYSDSLVSIVFSLN